MGVMWLTNGVVWFGMGWYDVIWRSVRSGGMVWCTVERCDVVKRGVVRWGGMRLGEGVALGGLGWDGVVLCGLGWCGGVWLLITWWCGVTGGWWGGSSH